MSETMARRHQVVVIGSGFGGLFATKQLRRANADVTNVLVLERRGAARGWRREEREIRVEGAPR